MSESARRERSTASTARNHFTSKTSRLGNDLFRPRLGTLAAPSRSLLRATTTHHPPPPPTHFNSLLFLQAHDEICPKYPMICEGCAKKKIPREKVRPSDLISISPEPAVELLSRGFVFSSSRRVGRGEEPLLSASWLPQRSRLTSGFKNILAFTRLLPFTWIGKQDSTTCITAIKISQPETHKHPPHTHTLPQPHPATQMATKAIFHFLCKHNVTPVCLGANASLCTLGS